MPLCLAFIDLKKVIDSVEKEAAVEALDNKGVPTQYIKVLREFYNFTTGVSSFYKNIIIEVKSSTLNGTNISECTSYVYLGRELNMMNESTPELGRRRRAAWGGCSEEDQEHPAPCSPLQHHRTSCFDLCFENLGILQAGRQRENVTSSLTLDSRHRTKLRIPSFTCVKQQESTSNSIQSAALATFFSLALPPHL
ncbi:hypothetical protein RB195_007009 [Necator americanus]|uniref:Uncharacterized protein n=1 Tax=Necator americanus TaxID=51031 RepID=A0ABR1BYE6_NECAM